MTNKCASHVFISCLQNKARNNAMESHDISQCQCVLIIHVVHVCDNLVQYLQSRTRKLGRHQTHKPLFQNSFKMRGWVLFDIIKHFLWLFSLTFGSFFKVIIKPTFLSWITSFDVPFLNQACRINSPIQRTLYCRTLTEKVEQKTRRSLSYSRASRASSCEK